jgi:phenylacetate-CoA ligase
MFITRYLFHLKDCIMKGNYPFHVLIIYKKILKSQYDKNSIRNIQIHKIQKLLNVISHNIPFYKNSNIQINDIKEELDTNSLHNNFPILTKQIIRNNFDLLVSNINAKHILGSTSGSTGFPLTVKLSSEALAWRYAYMMRFLSWYGIKIYDRHISIEGEHMYKTHTLKRRLILFLKDRLDINAMTINKNTCLEYYSKILKLRPIYMRGYPSGFIQLITLLKQNNIQICIPSLKLIVVTSEQLYPKTRKIISEFFNVPVVNEYGCVEFGYFAFECPHGGFHINEESIYLEVDANNELSTTNLDEKYMPLINYQNMDRVIFSDKICPCGRKLKMIENVEGRLADFIQKPNGDKLNMLLFYIILDEIDPNGDTISQYRVEQIENVFKFYIVKAKNWDNKYIEVINRRMKESIDESILVEFIFVDEIPREKSGKLRDFVRIK